MNLSRLSLVPFLAGAYCILAIALTVLLPATPCINTDLLIFKFLLSFLAFTRPVHTMLSLTILSLSLQTTVLFVHAQSIISPQSLAASLSLTTSTSYPFPTSTLSSPDASNYVAANWGVSHERFQDGTQDFTFVDDPFPNNPAPGPGSSNTTSPVIQVTYPAGSVNDNTGGAQFVTLWNNTDSSVQFETMMVSYEIAFNSSFEPVLGGKLPGLRGGINTTTTTGSTLR